MVAATFRIQNAGSFHREISSALGEATDAHRRGDLVTKKFPYFDSTVWENDIWLLAPAPESGASLEKQIVNICKILAFHKVLIGKLLSGGAQLDIYCALSSDAKDYFQFNSETLRLVSQLGIALTLSIIPTALYPADYPAIV